MQNKGNLEKRRLLKLNLDDELRDLQNGEMRYALNCRVGNSDNDNQGDIENVKGNVLVSFKLPTGNNKCIGTKEDLANKRIFYFVYNDAGNHGIYEYSESLNTITLLLQSSLLNFDPNYLITGIVVVNDLLYWTDNLNEPMKIDIAKAKLPSNAGGYPTPFSLEYIYAIKPPQPCEPKVAYGSDNKKNTNFLKQKLFQFKARYIYDNDEKSVPSPISIVATPTTGCNPQTYSDNYIEVTVETGNGIVKQIEIFAREVSDINLSQTTDFYTITILDKKELGIPDNLIGGYGYKFYNDKNYIALDPIRSNQLQDFVPLKAKAQELVDGNILTYGNIEEGFDPVDVKAKVEVGFEDNITVDTITITGKVFIGNPFVDDCSCAYSQPIYIDDNNSIGGYEWGGFGWDNGDTVYVPKVGTNYNQSLPLGGFVAYLAGTTYYDITQQVLPNQKYGVAYRPGTFAYEAYGEPARDKIVGAIRAYCAGDPQIYSTFTISNIPQGSYILRFASHLTTQADLADTSLKYQRTSTRTSIVGGKQGHEINFLFQILPNGQPEVVVDGVNVTAKAYSNGVLDLDKIGNQYGGRSWILDLTFPDYEYIKPDQSISAAVEGYVCDKDGGNKPGPAMLDDTRIHLAKLDFIPVKGIAGNTFWGLSSPIKYIGYLSWVTKEWPNSYTYTDHNGYFFIGVDNTQSRSYFTADIYTGNNLKALASGNNFYEGNSLVNKFDFSGDKSTTYYIQNTSPSSGASSVQEFGRTRVYGTVVDNSANNNPVNNFNIQVTRGGSGTTNSNGYYEIYTYGNHVDPFMNNGQNRDDFIAGSLRGDGCYAAIVTPYAQVKFSLSGSYTQKYNAVATTNQYWYQIPGYTSIVSYIFIPTVSLKRGATYEYGIVYYDHGLRNGTTQTKDYFTNDANHNYGLKLYVPFYTDTFPGATTVIGSGKPVISWAIANKPPSWATHYQWVRTKRGSLSNYIQWTLQSIEPVDDLGVPQANYSTAPQIKISVNSIIGATLSAQGYKQRNKNSILTYSFVEGDRIRFIRQSNGALFPQYYDVEIKGVDSTSNPLVLFIPNSTGNIQLKPGDLIEIYRPQFGNISVEEDIFYEIGECYEIGNAGTSTAYHTHGNSGNTTKNAYSIQDQDVSKTWSYNSVSLASNAPYTGLTLITGNTNHKYKVNDTVILEQLSGVYNPTLSSGVSVVGIPNSNQIIVSIPYNTAFASLQSGTVYFPATGVFYTGDTYYKLRNIPYSSNNNTTADALKWWQIEDENFSDFWVSSYPSIGRPNKVDKQFKKIRRPTTIYHSGSFVPETNINDLNNILDTDFETYERSYGSIQKLHNINRMLDVYQELKVGRIPIKQKIWKDVAGSSVVATSDTILNPIDYYAGEYGIGTNPESFSVYGYRRYFIDANRGVFLRLSNDGLTPISEHNFKAHNFFTDECKKLTALGVPFHIYTVYDQKFTECVVAFEDVYRGTRNEKILIYEGKTLSFNEDENTWASFYSYKPDFMVSNDTDIITFKDGNLYKHNENSTYNEFYKKTYPSEVWFPVNGEPSKEKVFQAISFEDADAWDVVAVCPNGMETFLSVSDFTLIRNMQYAPFKNDIYTPNTWNQPNWSTTDALIDGQKMQDYVMLVKLSSSQKTFQKLYAVNVLWTPVERSNK